MWFVVLLIEHCYGTNAMVDGDRCVYTAACPCTLYSLKCEILYTRIYILLHLICFTRGEIYYVW
jgi:hypothetical protein